MRILVNFACVNDSCSIDIDEAERVHNRDELFLLDMQAQKFPIQAQAIIYKLNLSCRQLIVAQV